MCSTEAGAPELRTRPAGPEDIAELAGRMYEAVDIQLAIENGEVTSLAELVAKLKDSSGRMHRTIKAALGGEPITLSGPFWVLKD